MKNKDVLINCVLTDFYNPLYEKIFLPNFKHTPHKLITHKFKEVYGEGFGTSSFLKVIIFKIEKIIESLKKYDKVIWSDVDLFFCKNINFIVENLLKEIDDCDLSISRENFNGDNVNTGFFIARASCCDLFSHLLELVKIENRSEQVVLQDILDQNKHSIRWKILPCNYWNTSLNTPIPEDVNLIHANLITPRTGFGFLHWSKISTPENISKNYVNLKIEALNYLKKNQNIKKIKLI
jgi:hypothetical protein